ncbi:unnamed protein product [Adineta ricciae]|uniref:Uncharacterized protein n=1 Tax=Adineta ricciae TaxID=249248 RepID=A0A814RV28_ADIRI|nr:unnamed protein product [Adineta ricciae]
MSIQHTAESALHSLEELYRAIDSAAHQPSPMPIDDSENLVQALCNLSHLIRRINETGMCGHPTSLDCNRISPERRNQTLFDPHLRHYEDKVYMNSVPNESDYGECILYHPIRIITTSADQPIVIRGKDSVKYDRFKRFSYGSTQRKIVLEIIEAVREDLVRHLDAVDGRLVIGQVRYMVEVQGRVIDRFGTRKVDIDDDLIVTNEEVDRVEEVANVGVEVVDVLHGNSNHLIENINNLSCVFSCSDRQIPSPSIATSSSYPSNQINSASTANQPSSLQPQPYMRSVPSSAPNPTTSSSSVQPNSSFAPTIPLPPPPITSSLHHSHMSPQIPMHGSHNPPLLPEYQQVPVNNSINSQQQQQQQQIAEPSATADSLLTSRSENCPECRAITRLLQWAPLKCYDAAGIRRGVFLAGPKSEQLLQALYASMKDSSFSLDDIEDCLCDTE